MDRGYANLRGDEKSKPKKNQGIAQSIENLEEEKKLEDNLALSYEKKPSGSNRSELFTEKDSKNKKSSVAESSQIQAKNSVADKNLVWGDKKSRIENQPVSKKIEKDENIMEEEKKNNTSKYSRNEKIIDYSDDTSGNGTKKDKPESEKNEDENQIYYENSEKPGKGAIKGAQIVAEVESLGSLEKRDIYFAYSIPNKGESRFNIILYTKTQQYLEITAKKLNTMHLENDFTIFNAQYYSSYKFKSFKIQYLYNDYTFNEESERLLDDGPLTIVFDLKFMEIYRRLRFDIEVQGKPALPYTVLIILTKLFIETNLKNFVPIIFQQGKNFRMISGNESHKISNFIDYIQKTIYEAKLDLKNESLLGDIITMLASIGLQNKNVVDIKPNFFKVIISSLEQVIMANQETWRSFFRIDINRSFLKTAMKIAIKDNPSAISKVLLEFLNPEEKWQIVKSLLNDLSIIKSFIDQKLTYFIRKAIDDSAEDKIIEYKKLAKITNDIEEMIEIVKKIERDQGNQRQSWNSSSWKTELKTDLENFFKRINLSIEKMSAIITTIEAKGQHIKDLFYEPHLRTYFEIALENKNFNSEKLEIIGNIFSNKNLDLIYKKKSLDTYIRFLIKNSNLSFSVIFKALLKSDVNSSIEYLKNYAEEKRINYGERCFDELTRDFAEISDESKRNKIIKEALIVVFDYYSSYSEIFEIGLNIERNESMVVKNEYINRVFLEITKSTYADKEKYFLFKIEKAFGKHENCYIATEIKKRIFTLIKPQDFKASETRLSILKEPSSDQVTYFMLRNSTCINKQVFEMLIACIVSLIQELEAKTLTVQEGQFILNQKNRKIFLDYLGRTAELKNTKHNFVKLIDDVENFYKDALERKEYLKLFTESFLINATDSKQINQALSEFCNGFFSTKISEYRIPDILQPVVAISLEIRLVYNSELFKEIYIKDKLIGNLTSQQIISLFRQAYAEMKAEMQVLFLNMKQFKVERVEHIMKSTQIVKEEIKTMSLVIFPIDQALVLHTKAYQDLEAMKKILENHCESLVKDIEKELSYAKIYFTNRLEFKKSMKKIEGFLSEIKDNAKKEQLKPLIISFKKHLADITSLYGEYKEVKLLIKYLSDINLSKFTENVLSLQKSINLSDTTVIQECERFQKLCINEKANLYCDQYLRLCINIHNVILMNFSDDQVKEIVDFTNILESSTELISFCYNLKEEEIDYLKESVNDIDEEIVRAQDIIDLEEIWIYLKKVNGIRSYSEFALSIIGLDDNYKAFVTKFEHSNSIITNIKEFHQELNLKEEAKKKQIIEIINNSDLIFIKVKNFYDVELTYQMTVQKGKIHAKRLNDLLELKDRAALITNSGIDEESKININVEFSKITAFIEFVNCVCSIIDTLRNLQELGYPELEPQGEPFHCRDEDFTVTKDYEVSLQKKSKKWLEILKEVYLRFPSLTSLYGKQFWVLETYFFENKKQAKAETLLEYIGKIPKKIIANNKEKTVRKRMIQLGKLIESMDSSTKNQQIIVRIRALKIEQKIFQQKNQITYIISQNVLEGILTLFLQADYNFPRADQILFCTSTTSSRELLSFAHRCFGDSTGQLYLLVNCERMTYENQQNFIEFFQELYDKAKNEEFKLGIFSMDSKSQILEFFKYHKQISLMRINKVNYINSELLKAVIAIVDKNTTCITSAESGFGKTFYVKNRAKGRAFESVSINGEISLTSFAKNLCKIQIRGSSTLLIKVNVNSDMELVNNMIMNLSLFKALVSDNRVFILSSDTELYVEIANSFNNILYESLAYITYLKQKHIDQFNINDLNINDCQNDWLNYVGNYFKLYKEKTLNSKELDYNKRASLVKISNQDLANWLKEELKQEDGSSPNFILVDTFVRIMGVSLKMFEQCFFFQIEGVNFQIQDYQQNGLQSIKPEIQNLRTTIFEALLKSSKEFTTKSIKNVSKNQNNAKLKDKIDENEEFIQKNECNVTWESADHFVILFTEDGGVQYLYRTLQKVPDNIKKIIYIYSNHAIDGNTLNANIKNNKYTIEDYSSYTHRDFLLKLKTYSKKPIENTLLDFGYILTPDNFLKMNLIYIRARAKIPIVIMGETGVGKTSLLRFFVIEILDELLEIFCIHAGTQLQLINEKMKKFIENAKRNPNTKLWVFFDEFNTNENLGVLCEIMMDRVFNNEPVPENLVFCAACNPYRKKNKSSIFDQNVGIQRKRLDFAESNSLMHMVKPLPDSIINFIWDFGSLTENDLQKYIETMLKKIKSNYDVLFSKLVIMSHNLFKHKEDCSSISLRDVERFIRLYNWFKESREKRKTIADSEKYKENVKKFKLNPICKINDQELVSGILSFCHCYYLRISNEDERVNFLLTISKISSISIDNIENIIKSEQDDLLARMELKPGTALNHALRENLFAIIPCIFSKLPVLICGKPGCSKSLAISLVFSNFKGVKSSDDYFKTIPELIQISYQGSESCTSEGIEKVFERAEKYLTTTGKNLLPVIVFDEIGLAEISIYNPLKILHSLLEMENIKVGFVAISNWKLDASKMNRVLYLARPDPTEQELEFTAKSIYFSICKIEKFQNIISFLSRSYFDLKNSMKKNHHADFYGLRDFYNVVKQVSYWISKNKTADYNEVAVFCKLAIERNFGGMPGKTLAMWGSFCQYLGIQEIMDDIPESRTIDLIMQNFSDKNSRFLMIICNKEVGSYILEKNLRANLTNYKFIVGSSLEDDLKNEDYAFNCLSNLILDMEKGKCIVLNDVDQIYSSLYDLFNQNYSVQGDRKYCRVALGAFFNPRCFVHPDFHVVIFLDNNEEVIMKTDAPFLNRFEKHRLNFNSFLSNIETIIVAKLENWIKSLYIIDSIEIWKPEKLFPIYTDDALRLLVSNNCNDDSTEENIEEIIKKCKIDLMKIAPADILVITESAKISFDEKDFIRSKWRKLHEKPFYQFLEENIESEQWNKFMVLTYQAERVGKIFTGDNENLVYVKQFTSFKSDREFDKDMQAFIQSKYKMCIIELEFSLEHKHMNYLKYKIENLLKEFDKENKKKICLVVVLSRSTDYPKSIPLYREWCQIMFDKLEIENKEQGVKDKRAQFKITDDLLKLKTKEIILRSDIFDLRDNISYIIENALMKFDPVNYPVSEYDAYINFISTRIHKEIDLIGAFESKITDYFKTLSEIRFKDWKRCIFTDKDICDQSRDVQSALFYYISSILEDGILQLVFQIEKAQAFSSYFYSLDDDSSQILKDIWKMNFEKFGIVQNMQLQKLTSSNQIDKFKFALNFPFSTLEFKKISEFYATYSNSSLDKNAKESFRESLNKNSITGKYINNIIENPEIENLYFQDLLKLFLNENNLDQESKELMFSILKMAFTPNTCIEYKVLKLMELQPLLMSLSHFIKIAETYQNMNLYKKLHEILQENMDYIDEKIYDFDVERKQNRAEINGEDEQAGEEIKDQVYEKDAEIELVCKEKIRIVLEIIINKICEYFLPEESLIKNCGESTYLNLIKKISNMLHPFQENENLKLENYKALQFIYKALAMTSATGLSIYNIANIAIENMQLKIYDEKVRSELFEYIELGKKSDVDEVLRLKMHCYNLLILNSCEILPEVLHEIQTTDIWKYSKIFFKAYVLSLNICYKVIDGEYDYLDNPEVELLLEKNEYFKKIDSLINSCGTDHKFSVLICDIMQDIFKECIDDSEKSFEDLYTILKLNIRLYCESENNGFEKLIFISRMKSLMECYIDIILNDKNTENETLIKIDELILACEAQSLVLYGIKLIKAKKKFNYVQVTEFIRNSRIQWIKLSELIDQNIGLTIYPFCKEVKDENLSNKSNIKNAYNRSYICQYSELLSILKSDVKNNQEKLKELLQQCPDSALTLGLAFINEVFIFYQINFSESIDIFRKWYTKNVLFLERSFGNEYSKLLGFFLDNFPLNSPLRITPKMEEKNVHRILAKCFIFLQILTKRKTISPLTSIFFDTNGAVHKNLDQILTANYICGDFPDAKLMDVRWKLAEYNNLKEKTTYICSNSCDYIYFVPGCGLPMSTSICPFDKVQIGGTDHTPVIRTGHQALSDDQAKAHLQNCIIKYENNALKGCHMPKFTDGIIPSYEEKSFSCIKPVAFYAINVIIKTCLLMIIELKSISTPSVIHKLMQFNEEFFTQNDIANFRQNNYVNFLNKHIDTCLNRIEDVINKLGSQETHAWIYALIGQIPQIISTNLYTSDTPKARKNFEISFETNLIDPLLVNISQVIINYKSLLIKENKISKESLVTEAALNQVLYPYTRLFRITRKPDKTSIKTIFNNQISNEKRKSQFFLVKIYFEMNEKVKILKSFYPILEFTNYLIEENNHKIPRDEARNVEINQVLIDEKSKNLFDKFIKAWKRLPDDCLQYECHLLAKPKISLESSLSLFLIDNKEAEGGMHMAAAIIYLSNLQNLILYNILEQLNLINQGKSILDNHKYPPQSLKKENILNFSCLKTRELVKYYISNPEYGQGNDIVYDFDKIQNAILVEIGKKKLINPEKLNFMHYQFELLNLTGENSSIISSIRANIKQETLNAETVRRYERFFGDLYDERRAIYSSELKNLYSSMDFVLLQLKGNKENPSEKISDFCTKLRISRTRPLSTYITDQVYLLAKTELRNIIHVYNIIESEYFKYFCKDILKDEYKKENQKETINIFIKMIASDRSSQYPELVEIRNAVMRFIIRCSVADLDTTQPLTYYIERPDFWYENILDGKLAKLSEELGNKKITISNCYCLYLCLNETVKRPVDQGNTIVSRRQEFEEEKSKRNEENKSSRGRAPGGNRARNTAQRINLN